MKILVTGGAGFIGSNLVETLLKNGSQVIVFDNLSMGNKISHLNSENLNLIKGDLTNLDDIEKIPLDVEQVFHLAADPEVRLNVTDSDSIFNNNIKATFNLLKWFQNSKASKIIFLSSSTVYGDADTLPTPETYPCEPISIYGASKLACEGLISSFCSTYNKIGISIRLANVVGPNSGHGIIFDMLKKLKQNPNTIEILGDGKQNKSYLYIHDCISGIIKLSENNSKNYSVYNLGSDSQLTVNSIVDIILQESEISAQKNFTGGIDGRGWIGDVKLMLLDCSKIKSLGWQANFDSKMSIQTTVKEILNS